MDIGRSFTYMFEDPKWIAKLAIGGGIVLLGTLPTFVVRILQAALGDSSTVQLICGVAAIVASLLALLTSLITNGYVLTTIRNVAEASTQPLPEWTGMGAFFRKGLFAGIGSFVIFLPLFLLICCFSVFAALGANALSDRGGGGMIAFVSVCGTCVALLYALVAGLYLSAAQTRFALNDQLSTYWDFGGNWRFIQQNLGNYVVAVFLTWVAGLIALLGLVACGVGIFFTGFWASLVSAHLFGQVARGAPSSTDFTPVSPFSPPPMQPAAPA